MAKNTDGSETLVTMLLSGQMVNHTIQINYPTRCNSFTSLLLDVYVSLNMFQAPPHPSSGAYNCITSLWFYGWSVGGTSVVGRGLVRPRPTTTPTSPP